MIQPTWVGEKRRGLTAKGHRRAAELVTEAEAYEIAWAGVYVSEKRVDNEM